MKKFISICILALICYVADAQVYSIGASGTFYGKERIRLAQSEDEYAEDNIFCPVHGASIFYEKILSGTNMLFEGSYSKGKLSENVTGLMESAYTSVSAMVYPGWTIRANKRLQIPVYVGVGYNHITTDLLKTGQIAFGAKLRMKLYVSDAVGIFVGGNWKSGYGTYKSGINYDVYTRDLSAECGFIVSL